MKFPSIEQFRHVIKTIERHTRYIGDDEDGYPRYDKTMVLPILNITGTVKLHGTNAGVELKNGELIVNSRTKIITPGDDNMGFAKFVQENEGDFRALFDDLGDCQIFGEWAGEGINKGCAIHQLKRKFYVFAIRKDEEWLSMEDHLPLLDPKYNLFNITTFGVYKATVNFNNPTEAAEKLAELTQKVEDKCPVGFWFGKEGIGEGIVWTFDDPLYNSSKFWFKVKGQKHKVTKTKQIVEVDVEKQNSVNEFVEAVLTTARLEQGLTQIPDLDKKYTGDYLKWVVNDVLKEENDRLIASDLEKSDVTKATSHQARTWLFTKLSEC